MFDLTDTNPWDNSAPFLHRVDYFIVGSKVILASPQSFKEATGFPFQLAIYNVSARYIDKERIFYASYNTALNVFIDCQKFEQSLPIPDILEALEIFLKVCIRRHGKNVSAELFLEKATDGLKQALLNWGCVKKQEDIFGKFLSVNMLLPLQQFSELEQVYSRPLDVPWDFVPLDYDAYLPLLRSPKKGQVLDLGSGFGRNAIVLECAGFDVYGNDISPSAIERCRQLVREPQNFVVASATSLPFPNHFFDFVVDVGCLHFLEGELLSRAISEIARVLKPGGELFSRIFKPRPQQWLDAQPFPVSHFGMRQEEVLHVFKPFLRAHIWKEHPDINYITAKKELGR